MGGGIATLLTGIWGNPWGLDFFDLDFLTILTAYLFLAFGRIGAGVFALGQGFLIDVFSGGLHGLFSAAYLSVFFVILVGSRFFNLLSPKGQIIIVALSVLLKNAMLLILLRIFSQDVIYSKTLLLVSFVSIGVTGLAAPLFFQLFNHLRGIPEKMEEQG
ncbi:MAG: hypothetical protein J7M20_11385 [Deltaproteobacteria bacterium]|nr:hypothetical protein [Deltaproteobacteria bacterium]